MTASTEYPDLPFVAPASYGKGRDGKAVRYIVIHYTAGSERATSAEDGAAYDRRRTDGTSTHYFVDRDSIVQCVLTSDRANAARHRGNRLGIQYELCGTLQTRAQWLDEASARTLALAAKQVARDCRKYGIPVRRLTVAQTRAAWTNFPSGPKGIVGHVDCTNAYPEDGGTHTDPGPDFPWDVFLKLVQDEMEDDMPTADEIAQAVWNYRMERPDSTATPKAQTTAGVYQRYNDVVNNNAADRVINALRPLIAADDVDEAAIATSVLAGLTPERLGAAFTAAGITAESLAAALPDDVAARVVDILTARLSS